MNIETERLLIRNWRESDRDLFYQINSDDRVMAFFPFRRDRAQSDALMDKLRAGIEADGIGFCALEIKASGEVAGFVGLAHCNLKPIFNTPMVEIGWRLAPTYWGKGYASEAARALLAHGFENCGFAEIVSFAVHDNHRSTAVMERIGMRRDAARDFDHPDVPDSHPHQRRHVFYAMTRDEWRDRDRPAR